MRVDEPSIDLIARRWDESPSDEFHVATRNTSTVKRFYKAHEIHYSAEVKELTASAPDAMSVGSPRNLDGDLIEPSMPLSEAIKSRSSERAFGERGLSQSCLRSLLFHASGVRTTTSLADGTPVFRRNVANSGNLGSCEVFIVVHEVQSLTSGIYHYDSLAGSLGLLKEGHFRTWLREYVLYQTELADAPLTVVLAGAAGRLKQKYGDRGYRLALIDAGHVSQNLYLVATALGLAITATAGFIDDELDRALGLDGLDYASLLVMAVGHRATLVRE
ncbi:SagB/ThcOx family dehydrogenase [Flexivirga alba]|uniref:SagB/ThcOx family dehydrogenase n=1 Tax=Flexivirga alba TaxID=702742 RepID=A0ABW2AIN6_9MICO